MNHRCRDFILLVITISRAGGAPASEAAADPFPVSIRVEASSPRGELCPIYRFFGADEPNYAIMKDGRWLLAELGPLTSIGPWRAPSGRRRPLVIASV